jgi:hypothetical protein
MNNVRVAQILVDCDLELKRIKVILDKSDPFDANVPFLTKYTLIKTCGVIEVSYKAIVSDFVMVSASMQVQNYISETVVDSSRNPSVRAIEDLLSSFDDNWLRKFRVVFRARSDNARLESSLKSLKEQRNKFAHGNDPTVTFNDIQSYYEDSKLIIVDLDSVII